MKDEALFFFSLIVTILHVIITKPIIILCFCYFYIVTIDLFDVYITVNYVKHQNNVIF